MSFSLFSVIIILICGAIAAVEIYRGVVRGFARSMISMGSLITSLVASLVIAPALSQTVVPAVFRQFIRPLKIYKNLIAGYESYDSFIVALACAVISILLFVILFLLLRILFGCIFFGIAKKKLRPHANDLGFHQEKHSFFYRNDKLLGGIAGGLCALIVSMTVTSPLMGVLNIAKKGMRMAERADSHIWQTMSIPEAEINTFKSYTNDLPGNLLYELGGKYIFYAVAKTEIYGNQAYIMNEIDTAEDLLEDFLVVYEIIRAPKSATEEHITHLRSMNDGVARLEICHGVLAEHLAKCSEAWLDGKMYMKTSKPRMHAAVEPVLNEVLTVCAQSNEVNVKQNVATLINMYAIVLESGIAEIKSSDFMGVIDCLESSDLIDKLDAELSKNPYMRGISVSSIAMNLVSDKIENTNYTQEDYAILTESLAEAISAVKSRGYGSNEEMVSVLSVNAQKYINEFGVKIPDVIAEAAAREFLNSFVNNKDDITPEQIEHLLKSYLD